MSTWCVGDEKISVRGNSFSGVSRLRLLKILQRRAEQLGVAIHFNSEINDIDSLRADCHVLVGADGINSTVRQHFARNFEPNLSVRSNRYIWYGTNQLFHGLTLTFRENECRSLLGTLLQIQSDHEHFHCRV